MLSDGEDLTYMESAMKATDIKQMANKITLAALNMLYSRKCALKREIFFVFVFGPNHIFIEATCHQTESGRTPMLIPSRK